MNRVRQFFRELHRKGLHLSGLIIPLLYYAGLKTPLPDGKGALLTRLSAAIVLGGVTLFHLGLEGVRLRVPSVNRFVVRRFGWLMRRSEHRSITGAGYYLLGSFLAVTLFTPTIAIAAMLFLTLGDFAAALVGIRMGRVRLFARKSLEGSLACFVICFGVGLILFWRVHWNTGVWLALSGALAATLAEALPLRLNDNLTIPLLSGLAVLLTAMSLGVIEVPLP